MKKLLLLSICMALISISFAQDRPLVPNELRNKTLPKLKPVFEPVNQHLGAIPSSKAIDINEEVTVGKTYFDLQTNSAMQSRLYRYDDATFGACFTYGYNHPAFDDRGTGYNYFDGEDWGPIPTQGIESDRTGWPAYAPFGENGEIIVSHISGGLQDGLLINNRPEKGTGTWTETLFQGPADHEGIVWPRIATGGVDHTVLHVIALTRPVANGGSLYQGQDGALLYSRTSDGGTLWEPLHMVFPEINSDFYLGFDGDTYEIQAQEDNVAILIGEAWVDLILLKSIDGGENWTKTLIWENPYPLWSGTPTDTFYCADGSHSLAFDNSGMVHVLFGINRALSADGVNQSWFPYVDGVGYWNETRPVFSSDINSLNPYGHPDSELQEDYSLVGWTQDVNGDGQITFVDDIGTYQLGLTSMPQIHIDEQDMIWTVWSSVTETFDNGLLNYRHIWSRTALSEGSWWSPFRHVTFNIIHIFDECVWPALSATSNDSYFYMLYQTDTEPGLAERFSQHAYIENLIQFMEIDKIQPGVEDHSSDITITDVSQNIPNPFGQSTTVYVNLKKASDLKLAVMNVIGQQVLELNAGRVPAGEHKFTIDAKNLDPGIYFYCVGAGTSKITKKMIVE